MNFEIVKSILNNKRNKNSNDVTLRQTDNLLYGILESGRKVPTVHSCTAHHTNPHALPKVAGLSSYLQRLSVLKMRADINLLELCGLMPLRFEVVII